MPNNCVFFSINETDTIHKHEAITKWTQCLYVYHEIGPTSFNSIRTVWNNDSTILQHYTKYWSYISWCKWILDKIKSKTKSNRVDFCFALICLCFIWKWRENIKVLWLNCLSVYSLSRLFVMLLSHLNVNFTWSAFYLQLFCKVFFFLLNCEGIMLSGSSNSYQSMNISLLIKWSLLLKTIVHTTKSSNKYLSLCLE